MTTKRKDSVLVFSVALNGYQWCYQDCLNSHKTYAKRWGYTYSLINRPVVTGLGNECCWLKLTLMLEALKAGYNKVIFIDADAKIQSSAPPIEYGMCDKKLFYMARGYSNRFNSGVLMAKNCVAVRQWLERVIKAQDMLIEEENSVGWGENGHLIQYAKNQPFIGELDIKWNNTFLLELDDFIRHFNHGPLRPNIGIRLFHKFISRVTAVIRTITLLAHFNQNRSYWVKKLTQKVLKRYPEFTRI